MTPTISYTTIFNSNLVTCTLSVGGKQKTEKLKIGVANLELSESDIEAAVRKDKKPNISFERQSKLYNILNNALKEKVDLLVMPEAAIPVSWLPFMIAHARRHQMGIVFGLEYWVVNGVAHNLIIEALPFKVSKKYNSCIITARLKNHYAPEELKLLESVRLKPAKLFNKEAIYHKVKWRGSCFATYNCFELSDIQHRALFKSQLDLLIACVWNKDTNYYQHILESVVRDIHCYVIHSNTSQYGGSCILQPTKTETSIILYVKGGENASVLTTKLDIQTLRDFQYKSQAGPNDKFKPLPPGYDNNDVLKRQHENLSEEVSEEPISS